MKIFILILCNVILSCSHFKLRNSAQVELASLKLNWGQNTFSEETLISNSDVSKQIQNMLKHAKEDQDIQITPVKNIFSEGIVFSDPKRIASDLALRNLPYLVYWTVCGRLEKNEEQKSICINKAKSGVLFWVNTYETDGSPINELNLIPIFLSLDIGKDFFNSAEKSKIKDWLMKILIAEKNHFLNKKNSSAYTTNHRSWNLAVMSFVSKLLDDKNRLDMLKNEIMTHADVNLLSDGSTLDFHMRDALHYQIYNLEAYVWIKHFIPELLSDNVVLKIDQCLNFIRPYFSAEKQHIEFVNTTVEFDITRKNAGDESFQNKPWDSQHARKLLLISRSIFPSILSWSQSVVDEKYSLYLKFISKLN